MNVEIYEALEERGANYSARMPAKQNLEQDIVDLLRRPMVKPSDWPFGCNNVRRVVAKAGFHSGEMTRPSCHRFQCNPLWFSPNVIARNLGNLWWGLVLRSRSRRVFHRAAVWRHGPKQPDFDRDGQDAGGTVYNLWQ